MKYIIFGFLFLAGCKDSDTTSLINGNHTLVRYLDKENSVICYALDGYGDVDCVKVDKVK